MDEKSPQRMTSAVFIRAKLQSFFHIQTINHQKSDK
nr:MAG TPA: hypothetical protein [Caudoviricetes sp.]